MILAMGLLAGPMAANAELVQSTTGVYLPFRQCISGATACDSIGPTQVNEQGGMPGNSEAHASQEDPVYGSSAGHTKHTPAPGAAKLKASIKALPGARNGSSTWVFERYTNVSANTVTLTFNGTLIYDQTVPAGNAAFPGEDGTHSHAFAEMEIFTLGVEALEAGTTVEENNAIFFGEQEPGEGYEALKNVRASGDENVSGAGSRKLSASVEIAAGDSVWMITVLQSLGSNGASVNASLETTTTICCRSDDHIANGCTACTSIN